MRRIKIGDVAVDSGQLMVCDPCYIESNWVKREFEPNEKVEVTMPGQAPVVIVIREKGELVNRWDVELDVLGGKTLNAVAAMGLPVMMKRVEENAETSEFSYDGCCKATLSEARSGQLNFRMGHAGAGVAFSSGYGDGYYPVYGEMNREGRIVRVVIEMGDEAESKD
jgi:hypothetical protein